MKKLFGLIVMIFVLYLSMQAAFNLIGTDHIVEYELENEDVTFNIYEKFTAKKENYKDMYHFKIKVDDIVFDYMINYDFNSNSEVIKEISYYKSDNYKCIFPKYYNDVIINDAICYDNNKFTYFHNIENPEENLLTFIDNLNNKGYKVENWQDNTNKSLVTKKNVIAHMNNIQKNHYIGIIYEKDLYRSNRIDKLVFVDTKRNKNSVFEFASKNALMINNNELSRSTLYVYSIRNSKETEIKNTIKFQNYKVLGSYNNSIYIYDRDTKKEYEIDLEGKTISEVGNSETNIRYYYNDEIKHDKLENIDIENISFQRHISDYTNPDFDITYKIGNEFGYYYYIKKVDNYYEIYQSNIESKENYIYLFKTTDLDSMIFLDNYIYYLCDNSLKFYNQTLGNRTVITFNGDNTGLKYNVYIDENSL